MSYLDDLYAELQEHSYKRYCKRHFLKEEAPGIQCGVGIGVRRSASRDIKIVDVFAFVVWEDVQRLIHDVANLKYKHGYTATWAINCTNDKLYFVGGDASPSTEMRNKEIRKKTFEEALPLAASVNTKEKIIAKLKEWCEIEEYWSEDPDKLVIAVSLTQGKEKAEELSRDIMTKMTDRRRELFQDFCSEFFSIA